MSSRSLRVGEISPEEACRNAYTYLFKIVLVGESGVGKTSLAQRCEWNMFSESTKSTLGAGFNSKMLKMPDGAYVRMQLWDTAGQERFASMVKSYYRGAHGIIFVYSVTDRDSLLRIESIAQHIADAKLDPHHLRVLVGNKCDLKRIVDKDDGKSVADINNCIYAETSAKDGADATWDIFYNMTCQLYERYTQIGQLEVPQVVTPRDISGTTTQSLRIVNPPKRAPMAPAPETTNTCNC